MISPSCLVSAGEPGEPKGWPSSFSCRRAVGCLRTSEASSGPPCHARTCAESSPSPSARRSLRVHGSGRDLGAALRCTSASRTWGTSICCGRSFRSCWCLHSAPRPLCCHSVWTLRRSSTGGPWDDRGHRWLQAESGRIFEHRFRNSTGNYTTTRLVVWSSNLFTANIRNTMREAQNLLAFSYSFLFSSDMSYETFLFL